MKPARHYRTRISCLRSEEHTSELQSQSNLVCRLLLEKKKHRNRYSLSRPGNMKQEQQPIYMPGVEVQATAFLNLLRADWLSRLPWHVDMLILVALVLD